MSDRRSAIPTFYYAVFGVYEPILTWMGLLGTLFDPEKVSVRLTLCGLPRN